MNPEKSETDRSLTSSLTAFGGGGNVDLSSFLSFARRAPFVDLAFFPILAFQILVSKRPKNEGSSCYVIAVVWIQSMNSKDICR